MFRVKPFIFFMKPLGKIQDFFQFERFLLRIIAMWPLDSVGEKRPSCWLRAFARLYEIFMILLCAHMIVGQAIVAKDNWSEGLDRIAGILVSILIYTFCLFSTCYFIINSKKLQRLANLINEHFRQRSAKGLTYIHVMDSYEKTRKFAIVWLILCSSTAMFWASVPLLARQRTLPVEAWYPFDEKREYIYGVLYFIQILAQVQIGMVFGNGSGMYVVLVTLICGQYDILFCSFKNIHHTASIISGEPNKNIGDKQHTLDTENEEPNLYYCSEEQLENISDKKQNVIAMSTRMAIREALKDCIHHHQGILQVCYALEDFYNTFCLVKSLQMTIQLCFLVFVFVNTTSSLVKSLNLGQYVFMTLMELLIFTYLGEVIKTQSLKVGDAFFKCNWYEFDIGLRKDLLIFLPITVRPITITSAKFTAMDVERLKAVIAQAFSFFTLLQSFNN